MNNYEKIKKMTLDELAIYIRDTLNQERLNVVKFFDENVAKGFFRFNEFWNKKDIKQWLLEESEGENSL